MTLRKYLFLSLIITISNTIYSQTEATTKNGKSVVLYDDGTWIYTDSFPLYNIKPGYVPYIDEPKSKVEEVVIDHYAFKVSYNETHEQANWVSYELTKSETTQEWERIEKYSKDPKVKTNTADDKDYVNSGYDRGHLAPAADMSWSKLAMYESFYYSNISPQNPSFNRGIWKELEELVRNWANEYEAVIIVTGPVLGDNLNSIGKNKVSVPEYFYKVVLDYRLPIVKGIGFIIPNKASDQNLQYFACSIDSVEKITNIDFYADLPDSDESIIEKTIDLRAWKWSKNISTNPSQSKKIISSVQCNGITKSGARCKNKTLSPYGFCHLHTGQVNKPYKLQESSDYNENNKQSKSGTVQCSGTTQKGTRCKRMTTNANGRCYQH